MHLLRYQILEIESQLRKLLVEVESLKTRSIALEEENEKLRKELSEIYHSFVHDTALENSSSAQQYNLGVKNLEHLYNEGFHICSYYFGQTRNEDCLFCVGFMNRNSLKKDCD